MGDSDGSARGTVSAAIQLAGVARDAAQLIRQEIALARQESREKLGPAARSAAMLVGGGAMVISGAAYILQAAVRALSARMPPWAAYLLSGGVLASFGLLLAGRAARNLRRLDIVPHKTITSLREDREWLLHQIKSRLK